jgi:hypothetical protein
MPAACAYISSRIFSTRWRKAGPFLRRRAVRSLTFARRAACSCGFPLAISKNNLHPFEGAVTHSFGSAAQAIHGFERHAFAGLGVTFPLWPVGVPVL